jgi:hypothetical protein
MSGRESTPDVESLAVRLLGPIPQARKRYRTVYRNLTLTGAENVQELLPAGDDRVVAYVQQVDAKDIIIGNNRNDIAKGFGTTLKSGNNQPWIVQDSAVVYVACPTLVLVTDQCVVTLAAVYETIEG